MLVKGTPYKNPEGYLFLDQKRKLGLVKRIKKQIDKFGLTNQDLGLEISSVLAILCALVRIIKVVVLENGMDTMKIWLIGKTMPRKYEIYLQV